MPEVAKIPLIGWTHGTFADAISGVRGGFSVKCEDRPAQVAEFGVLKTGSVLAGRFDASQNKFVPPSEHALLRAPVCSGTIVFCRKNSEETIGAAALVLRDQPNLFLSDLLWELRPAEDICPNWLHSVLTSNHVRQLIRIQATGTQSTMKNISQERLLNLPLQIPPLSVQHKIAEVLGTWDEAIEKLDLLKMAMDYQLRAVQQNTFEPYYAEQDCLVRAREIFEPVSERGRPDLPLLAVMQDIGVVRRDGLDRRVTMPDGDISAYKVVRPGDFVISLRSFEGGLEFSDMMGLVSPAYTVLRNSSEIVPDFYRHYFKSRSFIGRLDRLIFGIRDGKQIAFRDFGDMLIPSPPVHEQLVQAEAMSVLEKEIGLEAGRIEAFNRQKRGLMQKLLTGEWRVPL